MKFTLSWLKDHLDTDASLDVIVDTLTRIGLEVEGVANPADALAPFTIARVLSAARHPQADKLQVLRVDTGDGAPDLRAFFDSDLRWLKHYGFLALDVPTLGEGLSR